MIPKPLFPNQPVLRFLTGYTVALTAVVIAWVWRDLMDPVLRDYLPTPTFFAAVTVTAWLVGMGPAILATIVGGLAFEYFFMPPRHMFGVQNWAEWVCMGIYWGVCAIIIACMQELRRSRARVQELALRLERDNVELDKAKRECHTYQDHLARLVRERTRKLEETVEDLHQFSYSIAHDLRAPLRAIAGYVTLAERESRPSDNGQEFFRRIKVASTKMDAFITDSLKYTRVLREELPMQSVDLDTLLTELLESYPNFLPEHADIELVHPLPRVLGNEAALTHVFSNLLTNAIKFVRPGQRPSVKVWAQPEHEGLVRVCVQDYGIGIPQEDQQRIWNMFQRLHGDEEYQGTGIGLAVVKKATARMGGKVGLQSTPGQGSTFWLDLPPARSAAALAA